MPSNQDNAQFHKFFLVMTMSTNLIVVSTLIGETCRKTQSLLARQNYSDLYMQIRSLQGQAHMPFYAEFLDSWSVADSSIRGAMQGLNMIKLWESVPEKIFGNAWKGIYIDGNTIKKDRNFLQASLSTEMVYDNASMIIKNFLYQASTYVNLPVTQGVLILNLHLGESIHDDSIVEASRSMPSQWSI